ncbi:MAG: DUF4136 domain-containing protein [Acidobacteria bacterium]|nr:DUF4136 domain-containing protein [Acidobacteriota bacterium]
MATKIGMFEPVRRVTIGLVFALTTTGCATVSVSSHVQRGLDFAQYRTYDWGPADALPTGDPRLDQDPFFQDHVQGAVDKQLAARGFELTSATPDLLLHYHASITRRIDVNSVDADYGYCYDDDCRVKAIDFEAGTLVLDIVDTRTNRVIWRGWAQQGIEGLLEDRDRLARRIDQAVGRTLERLPGAPFTSGSQRIQGAR